MLQLLQHLGDGATELANVPAPGPAPGKLLIQTTRSLVSAGTERMLVDFGKAGWIGKARQQPEKVRAVLNKVRAEGVLATWRAVRSKLEQPIPLGYCQVGRIAAVGDDPPLTVNGYSGGSIRDNDAGIMNTSRTFHVGDRIVSNGPHAEVTSVPIGLCARIPDAVSNEAATFTPLAAIALEGLNLLNASPGDHVVVTGLGLIGQLAVRLLRAHGCHVLGFDPSAERRALAEKQGAITVAPGIDPVSAALSWTKGAGIAGALITASTASNDIISYAARSCRFRGKVVLIGVVGLALNRADFYRNEVSFQVSCSYGRRDPRSSFSVQANFRAVLELMAAGRLRVEDLITHRYTFTDAPKAYTALADRSSLGILLTYGQSESESEGESDGTQRRGDRRERPSGQPQEQSESEGEDGLLSRTVTLRNSTERNGAPSVALIGAGNFAIRTLLPALQQVSAPPALDAIVSNQGASAYIAAKKFGAAQASTDEAVALGSPAVNAVFITTRHDAHAGQAIAALRAGKHVWVEKPLCLSLDELTEIERVAHSREPASTSGAAPTTGNRPILMVGFNRRFAPMALAVRDVLRKKGGAVAIEMTVNAGRLEPDHWTLDLRAGGGRIVGEGCHFVDLARFLVGAPIQRIECLRRDADGQDGGCFALTFADGSRATIDYRTDLSSRIPKEMICVSGDGFAATIHNWSKLSTSGLGRVKGSSLWSRAPRKGHTEALEAFLRGVASGAAPVALDEVIEVSRGSILMQRMSACESSSLSATYLAQTA